MLTDSDGVEQTIWTTDTDVTANTLVWDAATSSFVSTVTEDGVDVVGTLAVPDGVRACGDRSLIKDPLQVSFSSS